MTPDKRIRRNLDLQAIHLDGILSTGKMGIGCGLGEEMEEIEGTEDANGKGRLVPIDGTKASRMRDALVAYLGQNLAVLCARFNYRGILSSVGEDFLVLAQARAVEASGASSAERPISEDAIGSSVIISLNSVELIYQPNWCFAPLDD